MRTFLVLFALALAAFLVQGAAAMAIPARWVPDVGLLLVLALAIWLRSVAAGLVLAVATGALTDLLSGTLLGQHALLRMGAYGAARFSSGRLNLRGPLPQALFAGVLALAHAGALFSVVAFFAPEGRGPLGGPGALLAQALVNALAAPFVVAGVRGLLVWLGEDEGAQRTLRLETRKYPA